jgi:hypothetical protein
MRPSMYAHRVHELATICRANGYALALHGSLQRDLDAIAVPWTDDANTADTLVASICEGMGLRIGPDPNTLKPHGRRVWTLMLMEWGFVDLSVMPLGHVSREGQS